MVANDWTGLEEILGGVVAHGGSNICIKKTEGGHFTFLNKSPTEVYFELQVLSPVQKT